MITHPLLLEFLKNSHPEKYGDFDFFKHDYASLSSPESLNDMDTACARILAAINNREKICIYSDYDADGIPGAVVLYDFFARIMNPERIRVYIPDRHDEGYGIHESAIDTLYHEGITLIITCDVGITAYDAVEYAKKIGIDIIITDHHEAGTIIPKPLALVHPKLSPDYKDPMICGCAVAWQLTRGITHYLKIHRPDTVKDFPEGYEKWMLDLVGLATLSDMVPLIKENRIFAHYGLLVMKKGRRPGLRLLFKTARKSLDTILEEDVTFQITPRINAASRMDTPMHAFNALMASREDEAIDYVGIINELNEERKTSVAVAMRAVHKKIKEQGFSEIILVGDNDWSQGILGIIAGKICDEYNVPAFVWSKNGGGILKGSCRTPSLDYSVLEIMKGVPEYMFEHFGGHEGAGGFAIAKKHIFDLEKALQKSFVDKYGRKTREATLKPAESDMIMKISDMNREFFKDYELLRPFGVGNKKPVVLIENLTIISSKVFGKSKDHIEIMCTNGRDTVRCFTYFADKNLMRLEHSIGKTGNVVGLLERAMFGYRNCGYEIMMARFEI